MIQFYTEQQLEKHEKLNIDVDDALTIQQQQQQQQQKGEQIKQQEKLDNNNTSSLLIIIIRGKELRKREIIRNKKKCFDKSDRSRVRENER